MKNIIFILLTCTLAFLISQGYKCICSYMLGRRKSPKAYINKLFCYGGYPSTHTTVIVTLIITVIYTMRSEIENSIFAQAFTAYIIVKSFFVITDAFGLRLNVEKGFKSLKSMLKSTPKYDKDGAIPEDIYYFWNHLGSKVETSVGHKPYEVLGGLIEGIIVSVIGITMISRNFLLLVIIIVIQIAFLFLSYRLLKWQKNYRRAVRKNNVINQDEFITEEQVLQENIEEPAENEST